MNKKTYLATGIIALTLFAVGCTQAEVVETETVEVVAEPTITTSCDTFPDKLETCTKFKCQYIHPFFVKEELIMEKEILGMVGDKCSFTEQMPDDDHMECLYSEEERMGVAKYLRHRDAGEIDNDSMEMSFGDDGETVSTYTVNGEEMENLGQTALDNGNCIILKSNGEQYQDGWVNDEE
jgi:hypothetical protein